MLCQMQLGGQAKPVRAHHCLAEETNLQDNGQLLWRLLFAGAMLQPELKGRELLIEERAGLKFNLPFML